MYRLSAIKRAINAKVTMAPSAMSNLTLLGTRKLNNSQLKTPVGMHKPSWSSHIGNTPSGLTQPPEAGLVDPLIKLQH